ncbi:MAG: ABC-type uncharacterized transport system substrate-binding protein [Oleispira sp.]
MLGYWKFDVYYSTIRLADIKNGHGNQEQGLRKMAKEMTKNLKNYHYFSELKVENRLIKLTKHFSMVNPLDVKGKALSLRVFDPTYYIDMRHQKPSQILIHNNKGEKCSIYIETPKPSAEIIEYATTLDRTQKNTKGLGNYFAEQLLLSCL